MFNSALKKVDWPVVNLVDQLEQIIDNRGKTPPKSECGIPSLSAKSVKMGAIDYSKVYFVSEGAYKKFMVRGLPKIGDVLLTTEAPLGCVARLDRDDVCLAQRLITLRGKEGVLDNDYLRFYLSSPIGQHELISRASGSTVQGIKRSEFCKIDIILPPYDKQLEIASRIRSIEEKLELNRQTNQTLENIAQAIFKSWFVDFEPTRAKIAAKQNGQDPERAAMAAISGKTIEELNQLNPEQQQSLKSTAALFPSALTDSELGEIPEGWGIQKIEDIIELAYGKALKKTDRVTGKFPVYGSGGLTGTHKECLVKGPGIIVGRKGTVGALYWEDQPFYPIDTVFYVKCKKGMNLVYSYYLLQTLGLKNMNTDAAVPGLNRNNAYRLEIPKVPIALIDVYSTFTNTLRGNISIGQKETKTLIELRGSLLPKLLSGELETAENQKVVVNG